MTDLQLSVAAYVSSIAMAWLGGWIAAFLTKGYQLSLSNPFSKDDKGWRREYQVKAPLRGKFILPPSPLQLTVRLHGPDLFRGIHAPLPHILRLASEDDLFLHSSGPSLPRATTHWDSTPGHCNQLHSGHRRGVRHCSNVSSVIWDAAQPILCTRLHPSKCGHWG